MAISYYNPLEESEQGLNETQQALETFGASSNVVSSAADQPDDISLTPNTTEETTTPPTRQTPDTVAYDVKDKVEVGVDYTKPTEGTTIKKEEVANLYETNNAAINDLGYKILKNDIKYVREMFVGTNSQPVLNNQPVNMAELNEIMLDSKSRMELLRQANELAKRPDISGDLKWKSIDATLTSVIQNGLILDYQNKFNGQLKREAENEQGRLKLNIPFYTLMFDEKGNKRSRVEYDKLVDKALSDQMTSWEKKNPDPDKALKQKTGYDWMTTPSYAVTDAMTQGLGSTGRGQIVYKDPRTGAVRTEQLAPNQTKTGEGWLEARNSFSQNLKNLKKEYNYNKVFNDVIKSYNNPELSKGTKLLTATQMIGESKGGAETAPAKIIDLDLSSNLKDNSLRVKDASGKSVLVDGYGVRSNVKDHYIVMSSLYQALSGGKGIAGYGTSKQAVPNAEKNTKVDEEILGILNQMLSLDSRDKNVSKLMKGTIEFRDAVGGDKNYHAYTIKVNPKYFSSTYWQGSKEKPGIARKNPDLLKGITIYVPADVSQANPIGKGHAKGSKVDGVEALLSTTGSVQLPIDGAGMLSITAAPDQGGAIVGGYLVDYNQRGSYDTTDITPTLIRYDQATDITEIVKSNIDSLFKPKFFDNRTKEKILRQMSGVTNPDDLQ